eukprot:gene17539-20929_t
MPCILKVRIVEGRDLPIMDRSSALADAYVEIRCGANDPQKTDIKRKTLNPSWNQDFRFDFPNEADLQDKPLDIRVWDYDLVSKNDMIGTVLVDLNCLLASEGASLISGWFPIFDTLRGIRGELFVTAKLEIFQNANPFKDASAGVQFFSKELIVENDPEYHWTDTFRASRLSNFERQYLLYTLSGKLRRQMGKKVLEMGGNAVLGYKQHFDLEGDSGIVARGYGTAVTLRKVGEGDVISSPSLTSPKSMQMPMITSSSSSSSSSYSSSSDDLSDTSSNSKSTDTDRPILPFVTDVQLFTLNTFQSHLVVHIGGVVSSEDLCIFSAQGTAVVLDLSPPTPVTQSREYTRRMSKIEDSSEDLSGSFKKPMAMAGSSGGGMVVKRRTVARSGSISGSVDDFPDSFNEGHPVRRSHAASHHTAHKSRKHKTNDTGCSMCHIPYSQESSPFGNQHVRCAMCKKKYVPEILLATIELPPGIPITGKGGLIQARVCRLKKKSQGDSNATQLSESVPFIEYDLHNQLMYKLKVLGMNAAFGLKTQITFNDTLVIGMATATAVFLTPLPTPPVLHISRNLDPTDDMSKATHLYEIQRKIEDLSKINSLQLQNAPRHQQPDTFERYSGTASRTRGRSPALLVSNSESEDNKHQQSLEDSLDSSLELSRSDTNDNAGKKQKGSSSSKRDKQRDKKHHSSKKSGNSQKSKQSAISKRRPSNPYYYTSSSEDEDPARSVSRRVTKGKGHVQKRGSRAAREAEDDDGDLSPNEYGNTEGSTYDDRSSSDSDESSDEPVRRPIAKSKSSSSGRKRDVKRSIAKSKSKRSAFVVEVDDKIDEDKMTTLLDFYTPPGFTLCNTETQPGSESNISNVRLITAIRRVEWDVDSHYLNNQLSLIFNNLFDSIMFKLRELAPCLICGINVDVKIPEDDQLQLLFTAMVVIEAEEGSVLATPPSLSSYESLGNSMIPPPPMNLAAVASKLNVIPQTISLAPLHITPTNTQPSTPSSSSSTIPIGTRTSTNSSPFLSNPISIKESWQQQEETTIGALPVGDLQFDMSPPRSPIKKSLDSTHNERINEMFGRRMVEHRHVELTPLAFLPSNRMERYLGRVNIHLIKESFSVRDGGGLGVFSHVFLTEANAIVRAQVMSMGGNALVGYHIDEFNLILDSGPKDFK